MPFAVELWDHMLSIPIISPKYLHGPFSWIALSIVQNDLQTDRSTSTSLNEHLSSLDYMLDAIKLTQIYSRSSTKGCILVQMLTGWTAKKDYQKTSSSLMSWSIEVNDHPCNYCARDLFLLIMDDWLGINSLPPILTMQLGLAPQLSLYVTPHWSLDTAIIARAPLLLPLISVLCMITELWLVIVMTLIVSTCPIWCMLSIRVV